MDGVASLDLDCPVCLRNLSVEWLMAANPAMATGVGVDERGQRLDPQHSFVAAETQHEDGGTGIIQEFA